MDKGGPNCWASSGSHALAVNEFLQDRRGYALRVPIAILAFAFEISCDLSATPDLKVVAGGTGVGHFTEFFWPRGRQPRKRAG